MKKRNFIIIIGLIVFIVIAGGISYAFFVYNKDVADVSLTTGDISISLANVNGSINLSNVIPKSNDEGVESTDYIDFTVNATVDTEKIYYEVYILPKSGSTMNTAYLKTYLTTQNEEVLNFVTPYSCLPNSQVENGKAIYRGIVNINNDFSPRNETKNFRLRLWLDEDYSDVTSKVLNFDVFLYAKNVEDNFVIPANTVACSAPNWATAATIGIDNSVTGFNDCNNAQCALVKIDQLLR